MDGKLRNKGFGPAQYSRITDDQSVYSGGSQFEQIIIQLIQITVMGQNIDCDIDLDMTLMCIFHCPDHICMGEIAGLCS